jgi:hypothetical protein
MTLYQIKAEVPIGFPFFKAAPIDRRVEKTAQSFMFTRPVYQNVAAQNASYWHDAVYKKPCDMYQSIQIVPLYQQSITFRPAARYFLINEKNTLVVKGDAAPMPVVRDIRAEWLRLPPHFVGTFSVDPLQRQFGVWMEFNRDIKKFCHDDFFHSWWIAAAAPFQMVQNDLRLREQLFSPIPATEPKNIAQALNNSMMDFGKIRGKATKKSIAELYIKLGFTFMAYNGFQVGSYAGLILPTFGHQDPEFLFDPFLGHNRFFGFATAMHFQFPLNNDIECRLITLFFDIENLFFLRNFQHRSLDIRFKPWSRYLLLNKNDGTMNISAINVLSPRVKVQPFNFVDFCAGIRVRAQWLEAEIGYNLWAHGDEQLALEKPFPEDFGIAGDGTLVPGTAIGATASKSTIAQQATIDRDANGNPTFVPIRERDLDLRSGAARAVVAHRAHGSLGFIYEYDSYVLFWGLGGFIEIPQNNTALKNWGVWSKCGGSF